jgi:23S rRNA (pseudouridine1915-N3)-methyltransferase
LKIEIIFPGRIKNDFAKTGFDEYLKRLTKFLKVDVISLPASHSEDPALCIAEESRKMLKYLGEREFILLDTDGIELNTQSFASFIKESMNKGADMFFVVGGVYGVSDDVKESATSKLSLSKMTFTHSMALLLLTEQLYRSMKIISGQSYDH